MATATAEEKAAVAGKRVPWRQALLGLAVTIALSVLLYLRMDVSAFTSGLAKVNYTLLAPVLVLHALAWWFRGVRWRLLLSPFHATNAVTLFGLVMVGAMINSLVPARAGEIWRAYELGRREGLSRPTVFGTIVVERVLDGLVLALLGSVALLALGSSASLTILIGSMVLLFAVGLGLVAVLAHSARARLAAIRAVVAIVPGRYRAFVEEKLGSFTDGLRALSYGHVFRGAIMLTILTGVIDTAAYWTLGIAFGLDMGPQSYLLVVVVANLAIAVPVSIAGIGPFEFFVQQSLVLLGVSSSLALAYAVSIHGLTLAFVTLSGLFFIWASVQGLTYRPQPQPALAPKDTS